MKSLSYLAIAIGLAGCADGPCVAPPCALPVAVSLTIRASAGGSAPMPTVAVTNGTVTTMPCASACSIRGEPGTYILDVSAPGFASVHRSIEVRGTTPNCGCVEVQTANVTIDLVPI
jgi:hypothetical protein